MMCLELLALGTEYNWPPIWGGIWIKSCPSGFWNWIGLWPILVFNWIVGGEIVVWSGDEIEITCVGCGCEELVDTTPVIYIGVEFIIGVEVIGAAM